MDLDVSCVQANEGIKRIRELQVETMVNNLYSQGQSFESKDLLDEALVTYLEILKYDSDNDKAKKAITRIEQYFEQHIFYESEAKCKKDSGRLYLKRHQLVFEGKKRGTCIYEVSKVSDIIATENMMYSGESFGRSKPNCIQFNYWIGVDDFQIVQYKTHNAIELVKLLYNFNGVKDINQAVEEYIKENFSGNIVEAIAFYRERTGADLKTAKEVVIRLFE